MAVRTHLSMLAGGELLVEYQHHAEALRAEVSEVLAPMGLELAPEKNPCRSHRSGL